MKKLIVCSLVVNLALAFVYADRTAHWTGFFPDPHATSSAGTISARATVAPVAAADAVDPSTWRDLTTGELSETAARLRAAGYPLSLQRAILSALITERFAERHKALAGLISGFSWWRGNLFNSASGANVVAARQALYREEKEALEQLMGPDVGVSDYSRAQRARQLGALPAGKTSELGRIVTDYDELIAQVRNGAQGILLPEDREKIAYLEKEKRADITKLLTPDELFEYDLRSSSTASQLRYQLAAFDASEAEYRAIFKVQQAFEAPYGPPELMTPEQRRQRYSTQTLADLTNQIKAVLPADRFADYELKTDSAYLQANAVVKRLDLPASATADIVAVQKDIAKRAEALRADKTLTPDQRNLQLSTLGGEAVARLTPTLGVDGLAAYKQGGGGWINSLQHPPTPIPAKKP